MPYPFSTPVFNPNIQINWEKYYTLLFFVITMITKQCFRCHVEFTCSGKTFEALSMSESGKHCWEIGSCECVTCACIELKKYVRKDFYTNLLVNCYGEDTVKETLAVEEL